METLSEVIYPESDGKRMADNTKQFRWIQTVKGGLDAIFKDDDDVFVAGDFIWYPVQGNPGIFAAPDSFVAFGRPKGDRGSYKQWEEGNIAPQVVFEILSPSNYGPEMAAKLDFYDRYGVEEYYEYDPDRLKLRGWLRVGEHLQPIRRMGSWVSPRLKIRFELPDNGQELRIFRPDGRLFVSYADLDSQFQQADAAHQQAEVARQAIQDQFEQAQQQLETERAERQQERQQLEEALAAERQKIAELMARLQAPGDNQGN